MSTIIELEELIARLPGEAGGAARRIFAVSTTTGTLTAPKEMEGWITKLFGSVDAVRAQQIVRVTNLVTLEGALFNELRARRPLEMKGGDDVRQAIAGSVNDPFCNVETGTPADPFGRIAGRYGTSVSNIAKYDGFHGVLVFNEHDPLAAMTPAVLADHFATARQWALKANEADPAARYYFLMWNALWRAGGSIIHGHMQMTVTRRLHYPKVEALRRQALEYAGEYGRDYFEDLWAVHEGLGLGIEVGGARLMAYLAPIKERELLIVGRPGQDESALAPAIARGVERLRAQGVVAHNMGVYVTPLTADGSDWSRFPPVARIVDRGDPANRTSDIGAMELYAASVVSSDPFVLADALAG